MATKRRFLAFLKIINYNLLDKPNILYENILNGPIIGIRFHYSNFIHHIHPGNHIAEVRMLAVKPWR